MNKILKLSSALALLGSTSGVITQPIATTNINHSINQLNDDQQIIDFKALNEKVALNVLRQNFPDQTITGVQNVSVPDLNISDASGSVVDTQTTEFPQAIFINKDTLDNSDGNTERKLSTSSYKKEVTNKLSHTVTHGINVGVKVTIDVFNESLDYNFSDSTTESKETTITVQSPEQSFMVPAHKKYLVKIYLGQNDTKVTLSLNASLKGTIQGNYTVANSNITYNFSFPLALAYEQYAMHNQLPSGVSVDMDNQLVKFKGLADAENVSESNIYSVIIKEV